MELDAFLSRHESFFVKDDASSGGKGVKKHTRIELYENPALKKRILETVGVLEETICQHPKMASLNPNAVSTIRIATVIEKSGEVRFLEPVLRIGRLESVVDNFSSHGFIFELDKEHGIVIGYGKNSSAEKSIHSPTGVIMPGFEVPYWNEVLDMVMEAALKFPEARFVGWDAAITTDGPVLVEANMGAGSNTVQHGSDGCWNYFVEQR